MSKNYQKSLNHCGREINYPRFGNIQQNEYKNQYQQYQQHQQNQNQQHQNQKNQLQRVQMNSYQTTPIFSTPYIIKNEDVKNALVPPPGTDVSESPCGAYYRSKNISDIDENCKNCMYEAWSIDSNCDCQFNPDNICEFINCVSNNKKNGKCIEAYNTLFNIDDVQDEMYIPPFDISKINGCKINSNITTTPPTTSFMPLDTKSKLKSISSNSGVSTDFTTNNNIIIIISLIILSLFLIIIIPLIRYRNEILLNIKNLSRFNRR